MSSGAGLAVGITLTAGLAGSIQAAVMGELGERVGVVAALAVSTVVALAGGLVLLALFGRGGGLGRIFDQPLWLWSGGLLSLLIVLAITVSTPRIGVAATVGIVIAGNLVMAAVIDQFGLFGQDEIAIGPARLLGLALLAAGSVLTLSST